MFMGDWIDQLASEEDRLRDQFRHSQELYLCRVATIRAKLPSYIRLLKARFRDDIEKLRLKFPQDEKRHCMIQDRGELGFQLSRQGPFPRVSVQVEFNIEGRFAEVVEETHSDPLGPIVETARYELKVSLNDQDDLTLSRHDRGRFDSLAPLTEFLLRRVCAC